MTPDEIVDRLLHHRPLALDDPYALYAALRSQSPVHYDEANDLWVLTRFADIHAALRDRTMSTARHLLSNPRYATSATLRAHTETVLFTDDAATHGRLRRLVSKAFTVGAVVELEPLVTRLVDDLLDRCADLGTFDFMADFVDRLPAEVICALLGVPRDDIGKFRDWTYIITTGSGVSQTDEHMADIDAAMDKLLHYLDGLLEERARAPRDDLLSTLIAARDEGERLSVAETKAMAWFLLAAGSDTTSAFLGAATVALLRNPAQLRVLRDLPERLPVAIEELMRLEAPVHFGIIRHATSGLDLPDATLPPGARVWTVLAAGNRDPAQFAAPDELRLDRGDVRHLGFAHGMHVCLGAPLARMESRVALGRFFDRFAEVDLTAPTVRWVDHGNLRTIDNLTVTVRGRTA